MDGLKNMILSKFRGVVALVQFSITILFVIVLMYIFNKQNHFIRKTWAKLQMFLLGVKIKEIGKIDMSADLILINHQSLLDIVILESIHSRNIAWVAKKEIGNMPVFGHILRAPKMISIDRENKAGLVHLLKEVKNRLELKRPIAIFPEGTRTNGDEILKFKAGAKMVAEKFNLKIQPIILTKTKQILDSKKLTANPGEIKVIALESFIADKQSNWYEELENKMRQTLSDELKNAN